LIIVLCFILSVLSGCHYREGVVTDQQREGQVVFKRIAVVPFQRLSPEDVQAKAFRCPLCGSILSAEKFPQDAEKIIEDVFFERLNNLGKIQLIPPGETGAFFDRLTMNAINEPLPDILKKVGEELKAEGIIVGYIYRYRERQGYSYSVERPASVAFEIHLFRVVDGSIVWKGGFDKTQKSLSEDLFQISSFVKERGQWVTAKELATEGIEAILENFPVFKEESK
jgi:hypothetical protein